MSEKPVHLPGWGKATSGGFRRYVSPPAPAQSNFTAAPRLDIELADLIELARPQIAAAERAGLIKFPISEDDSADKS